MSQSNNKPTKFQPEREKIALIAELQQLEIKHNPEKILCIAKDKNGKIIFLEEGQIGRKGSGLKHILEKHETDFANRGITSEQIPNFIMTAIIKSKIVGYQGKKEPRRPIYKIKFNGKIHYVAISIGTNGYIVGANPTSDPQGD